VPIKVLVPEFGRRLDAWTVVPAPASKPASAAPATNAIFDFVMNGLPPSIEVLDWYCSTWLYVTFVTLDYNNLNFSSGWTWYAPEWERTRGG